MAPDKSAVDRMIVSSQALADSQIPFEPAYLPQKF